MADIRKRQSGRGTTFQVRYADAGNKSGYGYRTFPTRKAAQVFKAECDLAEAGVGVATAVRSNSTTVANGIDLWLNICERVGRDGREPIEVMTLLEYRRRAEVMKRYPWQKPIDQLDAPDIVQFRTWLLETVSRDLARRTLSSFHSVLIEMKQQGLVREDPASNITIRSGGRYEEDREIDIPSDQDVRAILNAADTLGDRNDFMAKCWARYRPMIYLAAFTGMRLSELRGLPWDNLHPDHVEIKQRADNRGTIGPVKSRAARRLIELSPVVTDLIFDWRAGCPKSDFNLVFPTSSGKAIAANNFRLKAWLPALREAGLTIMSENSAEKTKYTPHAMRHYYASKLIEKKKDAKFIQERLGHSSIEITFNVYGHLMKDREEAHKQTANELVEELLS